MSIPCPLCGDSGTKVVTDRWNTGLFYRCAACGGECTDGMDAGSAAYYEESYGALAAEYGDDKWEFRRFFSDARELGLIGAVLDVGCGPGFFMRRAKAKGYDAFGLDFNEPAVAHARSLGLSDRVAVASVSDIPGAFPGTTFGVATLFHVLEHVADPRALVRAIRERLAPRGALVIAVPNARRSVLGMNVRSRREGWDYPPHHLTRWDSGALRHILEMNGFSVAQLVEERVMSPTQIAGFLSGALHLLTSTGLGGAMARTGGVVGHAVRSVSLRQRVLSVLVQVKGFVTRCVVWVLFIPMLIVTRLAFIRGTNLYVVARKRDEPTP